MEDILKDLPKVPGSVDVVLTSEEFRRAMNRILDREFWDWYDSASFSAEDIWRYNE